MDGRNIPDEYIPYILAAILIWTGGTYLMNMVDGRNIPDEYIPYVLAFIFIYSLILALIITYIIFHLRDAFANVS